tara:strand:+ start:920 stop:2602 length:1683 start_codon:yes stop_codon:yes gene_type:complete
MNYYEDYTYTKNSEYGLLINKNNNYLINENTVINNRAIHNDIVYFENNKIIGVKTRNTAKISGILYLNKNTKYGFNSKNMPYYIFYPLNKKYPTFLVASSLKTKVKTYITIIFNKWPINSKYPYGQCMDVIGPINICKNMYEILLYKNNLIYPKLKIPKNIIETHKSYIIENVNYKVFTIDPEGCRDIDDALSINIYDTYVELGVHITDVSYFINDIYHLLYNLCSSIYGNHRQINILPDIYATNLCSLLENTNRKCISIIFKFSHNYELINYNIKLTNVNIIKNFSYDEAEEIIKNKNKKYKDLLDIWNFMSNYNKSITNTHILVEKLMVLANHKIAETLYKYDKNNTILRVHSNNENNYKDKNNDIYNLDTITNNYLKIKTYNSAIYEKNVTKPTHYGLNINLYTHFTSPIRRICDIITHINIKNYLKKKEFLEISQQNLDHINKINKNIKKLYNEYKIVDLLNKYKDKTSILCEGYLIDFTLNKFIIFIPEFSIEFKIKYYNNKLDNLYTIIRGDDILEIEYENNIKKYNKYDMLSLELYFIENEDNFENKIKIKIL